MNQIISLAMFDTKSTVCKKYTVSATKIVLLVPGVYQQSTWKERSATFKERSDMNK